MKKTLLYVIMVPVLAFIVFLFIGMLFTDKYVSDAFDQISNGNQIRQDSADVFNYAEIDSLPFTLQRFFKNSVDSGAVKPVFVRMKQTGEFKTDDSQPFRPLTAVEYFSIPERAFVWDAKLDMFPLIKIRAIDSFIGGKGSILIKIASSLTVTDAKGAQLDYSGLFRFFSEAVCFPTALLPSANVKWKAVNETTALLSVVYKDMKISALFYFDKDGRVIKITTRDKYRTTKTGYRKDGFTMYCRDYEKFGSFNVPSYFETEWNLPDKNFVYGKIRVDEIEYDIVKMY